MTKYGLYWAFVVVLFTLTETLAAQTLRQAVSEAVNTNPRIEAAQANYRATLSVLDQARGRYFPEVDLTGDVGKQRVDRPNSLGPLVNDRARTRKRITLTVRQALFDGWDRANDVYRSQARITAASHRIFARSEAGVGSRTTPAEPA